MTSILQRRRKKDHALKSCGRERTPKLSKMLRKSTLNRKPIRADRLGWRLNSEKILQFAPRNPCQWIYLLHQALRTDIDNSSTSG